MPSEKEPLVWILSDTGLPMRPAAASETDTPCALRRSETPESESWTAGLHGSLGFGPFWEMRHECVFETMGDLDQANPPGSLPRACQGLQIGGLSSWPLRQGDKCIATSNKCITSSKKLRTEQRTLLVVMHLLRT